MNRATIQANMVKWLGRIEEINERILEISQNEFPQPFEKKEMDALKNELVTIHAQIQRVSDIHLSNMFVNHIIPVMTKAKKLAEGGNSEAKKFYDEMKEGYEKIMQELFLKLGKDQ